MKALQWPRFLRRRARPDALPSRWQTSTVMPDSRWQSSYLSEESTWLSTGMAGDSRLGGMPMTDEQRWRRQLNASRRWAVWGVVLGSLLGCALFAPAQWLADGVASATNGHVLLAEARGSIWNGSAIPVLTGGPGSRDAAAPPGRLYWSLRPSWNGLNLEAQQPCCINGAVLAQFQPGLAGYTLKLNTAQPVAGAAPAAPNAGGQPLGQWPTAWLGGLGTPWNTLQLRGLMQLSSPGLTVQSAAGRVRMDGALMLELRDLSSRLSPLPVLGSYQLKLQGQGGGDGGSQLVLNTLSGALRLTGSGQLSGARLRFRGQAEAEPGQEGALANLLNIIGRRQGALSVISIG